MTASNILKSLGKYSIQEYLLGAPSCKKAEQRVYLVENILDEIMRERRVRVGAKRANGCKTFDN